MAAPAAAAAAAPAAPAAASAAAAPAAPRVIAVRTRPRRVRADAVPELRALFALEELPLGETDAEVELAGVPLAAANALRRVLIDELPGRSLQVPADGWRPAAATDPFMLPQFVNARIALLPLRRDLSAAEAATLRLKLCVANASAVPRSVYAGELEAESGLMPAALLNPTARLAVLQPGGCLDIRGIRVAAGVGRDDAAFQVACRGAFRFLDVPQYPPEDLLPLGAPHCREGGYTVPSTRAAPRHFAVTFTLPATTGDDAEVRAAVEDACRDVVRRLRPVGSS